LYLSQTSLTAVILVVLFEQGPDLPFERNPHEFEEDGGDPPDEQIQESIALEVGEEWPREDVKHGVI
jgi:hypothetical protein